MAEPVDVYVNVKHSARMDAERHFYSIGEMCDAFDVTPRDPEAPGYLKYGFLGYAGGHYLKFTDGPYWLRGGTDEPENLLAYEGFASTPPKHKYDDHNSDWRDGDARRAALDSAAPARRARKETSRAVGCLRSQQRRRGG